MGDHPPPALGLKTVGRWLTIPSFVTTVCLFLKQEREKDCLLVLKQKEKEKPAFRKGQQIHLVSSGSMISQQSQMKNKAY